MTVPFTSIVLSNPALLAGALALAVPYLVHLLTRRTPVVLVFPTVRFIKKAEANQSALFRLRDVLLLLLRMLAVALLLIAFLKPVLHAGPAPEGDADRAAAAIVVLDCSLSMGYSGRGFTPFARGQQVAQDVLDRLRPDDVANLILARAAPVSSFESPAPNPFHLKRDVQDARPTAERADINAAFVEAVRQLAPFMNRTRSIYLISDFQRTNWSDANFAAIPGDIKTYFLSVAEASPVNLAVTDTVVRPAAPLVGEEVEIICKVANYSAGPESPALRLEFAQIGVSDNTTALDRAAAIPAGSTVSETFRIRARQSGTFEGVVRIPDDPLGADNARYFTLEVSDKLVVTLLTGGRGAGTGEAVRILSRALEPKALPGRLRTESPIDVITLDTTQFPTAPLGHVVVILGAGPLAQAVVDKLVAFIRDGGAVVYLLVEDEDAINLEALRAAAGEDFVLPFSAGGMVDRRAAEKGATFAQANFDDPLLRPFRDAAELAAVPFHRYFATERNEGRGQVLIRYDDGNIALARASLGAGQLLLCNFSVSRAASDLATRAIFLPFIHELVRGVRPMTAGAKDFRVGASASTTMAAPASGSAARFTGPDGEPLNAGVESVGDELAVIFARTEQSGFYRIYFGEKHAGSIAVNVDARESPLESLSAEQLENLAGASRPIITAAGHDPAELDRLLEGAPLWPYFLLAAAAALALEQALLLYLRR